jgi:D-alanyl-D-alanine carboxypeptidase
MKKNAFLCVLACLGLVLTACEQAFIPKPTLPPAADFSEHSRQAIYQQALDDYVKSNRLPGAVLLLHKAGEPLWIGARGSSNLEHRTAMQTNTPFRTASITKTFVATAIMLLQERGVLALDDPLTQLLPSVVGKVPQAETITLRHLLTHTSGIFDPTNDDVQYQLDLVNNPARRAAMSTDEVLTKYVYGHALLFTPGERYSYSNPNYMLIGKIIERKTGKSLQAVLEELILKPLKLTNTYLDVREDSNVARGYSNFYSPGQLMDVTALDRAEADGGAYGGVVSTAADLFRFSEALFGGNLVSAASLQEMKAPFPVRQGETTYGLAVDQWASDALGIGFGNNGTLAGTEANVFYFPQRKATFILLTNYGGGTRKDFLEEVLR